MNSAVLDQLGKLSNVVYTFEEKPVGVERSFVELTGNVSTTLQTEDKSPNGRAKQHEL